MRGTTGDADDAYESVREGEGKKIMRRGIKLVRALVVGFCVLAEHRYGYRGDRNGRGSRYMRG